MFFGYNNPGTDTVIIPQGQYNFVTNTTSFNTILSTTPIPTSFNPGSYDFVLSVT